MQNTITVRLDEEQFERLLEEVRWSDPFYLPPLPKRQPKVKKTRQWTGEIPKWASGMSY